MWLGKIAALFAKYSPMAVCMLASDWSFLPDHQDIDQSQSSLQIFPPHLDTSAAPLRGVSYAVLARTLNTDGESSSIFPAQYSFYLSI